MAFARTSSARIPWRPGWTRPSSRSTATPGTGSEESIVDAYLDHVVKHGGGEPGKLKVAFETGVHDTVGRDLVNHCVNDILVQGARPMFFMDYVGVGRMEPEVVSELIDGCAQACRDNGLALLGGETAEMPGLYRAGDFDLVGFIVGSVARERLLDGSQVAPGQVLLGVASSGLHTNGYSLARHVLFETLGLELDSRPDGLAGESVEEALLAPHRSYLKAVAPLLDDGLVAGLCHITGGGLVDNLPRVLGEHDAHIQRDSWETPPLFRFLCEAGDVSQDESYRVFNMGVGLVVVCAQEHASAAQGRLAQAGETVWRLGTVEAGAGGGQSGVVRFS